jgi:hypothetical protein
MNQTSTPISDGCTTKPKATANGAVASSPMQALPEERQRWEEMWMQVFLENKAFLEQHEEALLEEHPDWRDKEAVLCVRTPEVILAVGEDRLQVAEEALHSPQLLEVARRLDVPPAYLLSIHELGASACEERDYLGD